MQKKGQQQNTFAYEEDAMVTYFKQKISQKIKKNLVITSTSTPASMLIDVYFSEKKKVLGQSNKM
jgi:hypothetical protein